MTNVVYLNRSITYFDLDSEYDPVKNIFYVSIQFEVKQGLNMESDVIDPIAAERIAISNLTCVLVLTSSNNIEKREIVMRLPTDFDPIQTHISLGTNLNFYKQIDQAELENLMDNGFWKIKEHDGSHLPNFKQTCTYTKRRFKVSNESR